MTRFLLLFLLSLSLSFAKDECPEELNLAEKLNDHVSANVSGFKHRGYISPEEFRTLSSKEIGEKIVERIATQCDGVRGGDKGKTMGEESDIMMFVPSGVLEGIEQYGFQNQHVTRTTNGCPCREERFTAEVEFTGLMVGYGPKAKEVLPKYTALSINKSGKMSGGGDASHYGDTIFIFNDTVKKRTTWTEQDSLMNSPYRGSRVTNSLGFKDDSSRPMKCNGGYCEAQVWGSLDLSDVAYVMIKPGSEVPEVLKRNNIPVYFQAPANGENTGGFKKGEIAFAGKASRSIASIDEAKFTPAKTPNTITNRIEDHKKLSRLPTKEIIEALAGEQNEERERELMGELSLRKEKEVKDYLLNELHFTLDPIMKNQVLMGLSAHGSDKKVLEAVRKEFGKNPLVDKMILALAADTDGFKTDEALLKLIEEKAKNDEGFRVWYNRLIRHQSLCPREGHPDFQKSMWSY